MSEKLTTNINETTVKQSKLSKHPMLQSIAKSAQKFHNFINPQTVYADGCPRLISIDALRGFSIFAMILQHEVFGILDTGAILNYPMPKIIASYIIGVPVIILANWRTFIVLISGITNGFTQMKAKSVRQLSIDTLKRVFGACCIFPVFMVVDWLYCATHHSIYPLKDYYSRRAELIEKNPTMKTFYSFPQNIDRQSSQNMFVQPWFITYFNESGAALFYGFTSILINFINFAVQAPVLMFKKLKMHHKKYIYSIMFVILACIFSFCTHAVHYKFYTHFSKKFPDIYVNKAIECAAGELRQTYDTPANFLKYYGADGTYRQQSNTAFKHYMFMFINGHNTYMFPMWSNILLGSAFGCLLAGFYEQQKVTTKRQWNKTRKYLILTMWCSLVIPIIMYGISRAIAQSYKAAGKRSAVQSYLSDIVNLVEGRQCIMPEYLHVEVTIQFICIILMVMIFEARVQKQAHKHARRSLYLRRFSTASMTVYSFSFVLGIVIRSIFVFNPKEIGYYYGFMVLYFVIQLFLFIALDHADWIFTPDWFLSSIPKVLQGRFKKGTYAQDSHLRVKPIIVLEKFEEDAIVEEETRNAEAVQTLPPTDQLEVAHLLLVSQQLK
ncbi:Transmembrane_domain-containing protein [Hexamita inflata]|uniref:Transmembrane domain-containing protein n=1 Tax=Hexamita inflata TaxID=28002 RepID=A0AA86PN58_9EUKA|nr:Transmembrane domain-containing protein [Hexamita inflata]